MGDAEIEVIRSRAVSALDALATELGLEEGIEVVVASFDGAMSVRRSRRPLMRVNPERLRHYPEKALRACAAHELGHLVLHVEAASTRRGLARLWLVCQLSRLLHHLGRPSPYWRLEFEADAFAASLVGPEAVAEMLVQHVRYWAELDLKSWSHPPRRERIRQLGLELVPQPA